MSHNGTDDGIKFPEGTRNMLFAKQEWGKNRWKFLVLLLCLLLGLISWVLNISVHEIFGNITLLFFAVAIMMILNIAFSLFGQSTTYAVLLIQYCLLFGFLALALNLYIHPIFGMISPFFFIAACILAVNIVFSAAERSTKYVLSAISTGALGCLFLFLAMCVHKIFNDAGLIYAYAAIILGILSIAVIIGSKEIFRISGIFKITILFLAAFLIGYLSGIVLQGVREGKLPIWEKQTKLSEMRQKENCVVTDRSESLITD